jgi:anti-anti-sigma regulatory factor
VDFAINIDERHLYVNGELDHASAPHLHLEMASAEGLIDAVDLRGVTFIDSGGVEALLILHRRYANVPLREPSVAVQRIVDLLGSTAALFEGAVAP